MKYIFWLITVTFFSFSCSRDQKLFELKDSKDTGIYFSNRIVETDSLNILNFDYIYNGGGLAVGDFNNDGLQDLFYTGNQVNNTLYVNKGKMQFEDISQIAGVEGKGKWCSGVAVADINADGFLDIYIAVTSPNEADSTIRENLLFVNQGLKNGIPTFKEMAKEYGVNDNGHSENAVFIDYDKDGDLDLYVLTNKINRFPNELRPKFTDSSNPNTDRLYRNDQNETLGHPIFTNVSKEAGITVEGFGLGINVCDINNDSWPDIYVTNDYASNDLLYINNKNGTFTDQLKSYVKHTSTSAMGNDVVDINNDGYEDIFALDMLPRTNERRKMFTSPMMSQFYIFSDKYDYTYQYGRNSLQLNNGNGTPMSEIALLTGLADTDWSWTPSIADFDNDGNKDILITNGFPRDVTDRDFMAYKAGVENFTGGMKLVSLIPEVKISNYGFQNHGGLKFEDVTEKWGLKRPSFSSSAIYADLDNDGDLDYVVNNINDSSFVYENTTRNLETKKGDFLRIGFKGEGQNLNAIGTRAKAYLSNGEIVDYYNSPFRGFKSTVEPYMHLGLDSLEVIRLVVDWPNNKRTIVEKPKKNQVIVLEQKMATLEVSGVEEDSKKIFQEESFSIDYVHQELPFLDNNFQNLTPLQFSHLGPCMTVGDVNKDGLDDVVVGGAKGFTGALFIQNRNGGFSKDLNFENVDQVSIPYEDAGIALFDFDSDGDLDIYRTSGGNEDPENSEFYQDRFMVNQGNGVFKFDATILPKETVSGSCVKFADIDSDGDLDLFIGGRSAPRAYPKGVNSMILENTTSQGKPKFINSTKKFFGEVLNNLLLCDAVWADINGDKKVDLIALADFKAPMVFLNGSGKFTQKVSKETEKYKGFWKSINVADIDKDGDLDFILGNVGVNSLMNASLERPSVFLSADFDKNGVYDVLPFISFESSDGELVLAPYASLEDVQKMLNPLRSQFRTFGDYTKANVDNLLLPNFKSMAHRDEISSMESYIMLNEGKGEFSMKSLPLLAQVSTLNSSLVFDFNQDGFVDILIAGNDFNNEIQSGRMDASNGLLLLNDKKGNFKPVRNSGFIAKGDVKSMVSYLDAKGNYKIIVGQNSDRLLFYSLIAKPKPL